ncbi:DUF418 domain-containing protein [Haloactinomyces albus]|uniref:Membrane protein YeiB n=1 Tax=Haloactinomyces albus TaxID=1352928 RepID=A0AAE4CN42_9ACTN|nr:DUF418 domain-containing protein [Haloactinomyces albus]MDR7301587.1 putative membrane protein YeiB [Haloactinomyces albus]
MSEPIDRTAGASARSIGATTVEARALAPDLARGCMLLLIALGNAHVYLVADTIGVRGYPVVETIPDRVVVLLQMIFVDGRAYPMFAALFGYGIVQLARRQEAAGIEQNAVRKLIRRRGWWLLLFGLAHALLLFSGDILGSYGLLAIALAGVFTRARGRTLLVMAGLWMVPVAGLGALQGLPVPEGAQPSASSMSISNPSAAAVFRLQEWVLLTFQQVLVSLVPALLFGVWAARRRLLDEPERYRRGLRYAAAAGVGLAVAGGLPMALMASAVWSEPGFTVSVLAGVLHAVTGYAGGIGYTAVVGLVAIRLRGRQGALSTALTACGQRSMTSYLGQSVVLVAVLAAYGGGLGDDAGVAATAVLAVLVWMLTVVAAEVMRRLRYRGPAEVLLRRLTYGRTATRHGRSG